MADNQLQVSFSGDASGLTSAAGQAGDAIKQITDAVTAVQKSLGQLQTALGMAFRKPDTSGVQSAAEAATAAVSATAAAMAVGAGAGLDAEVDAQAAALVAVAAGQTEQTATVTAGFNQRVQASKSAASQMQSDWERAVTTTTQHFADGLLKMGQGTESFQKVVNQTANALETSLVNSAAKMLSTWINTEMQKLFVTQASVQARNASETTGAAESRLLSFETAQKQALNNAAAAAGAAYNAMAGIPVVGPALGAAAAAATFTAVEAFGALASAAGGYDIPAGIDPLVQAHAQEMILPARIANPMRDMLSDYAAGGSGPTAASAASGGGDTHNWHISALDSRSFETFLRRNSDTLAGVLNDKVRAGAKVAGR